MKYLLDTNVCIRYLRDPGSPVGVRLSSHPVTDVVLCSVVVAELLRGALRSSDPAHNRQQVEDFVAQFRSIPFDDSAAEVNARVRAHLEGVGQIIGPYDMLIAAIAIANDVTLVTHNVGEFSRVPNLDLVDWEVP